MPAYESSGFTRREWMRIIGAGAGAGVLPALHGDPVLDAFAQGGPGKPVTFPRGAIIRTLLRDVRPSELGSGATLFHEHLSINVAQASGRSSGPPPPTDDVSMVTELVKKAGAEGIGCIVDGGHNDMGRRMADLRTIAKNTSVHIVASGGLYMARIYAADIATKSEDQIADDLAREARQERFGAYGEIGTNPNSPLSLEERKVFRAVGKAHLKTGLPIFTHNAYGTGPNVPRDIGIQQLDILESVGVKPEHVAIGHVCCHDEPDVAVIKEIARRGAFVGFDRVTTLQQIVSDEKKVAMTLAFLSAGHADRLLLSADDIGQRTIEAGPGYGRTLTVFVPLLRKAGVDEATIRTVMHDNPRRFLAFVPK